MAAITNTRLDPLSIGQISRLTGVNIETIRYYERIKMLPAPPRTKSGRRTYRSRERRILAFIRRGRELGFTLEAIRTLLALGAPGQATCAEVRKVASEHLADVRARLDDLKRLEAILADAVARCTGDSVPDCPVLDVLNRVL
jgi:MerR family mercuric resistance operon transcriptional regulator